MNMKESDPREKKRTVFTVAEVGGQTSETEVFNPKKPTGHVLLVVFLIVHSQFWQLKQCCC